MGRGADPRTRPGGQAQRRRHGRPLAPWSASGAWERDHDSRADVGFERPDRRQRRLERLAEGGPRLSRACRRPEAEGGVARGRRPVTSESGSRGLAALVHPARRLQPLVALPGTRYHHSNIGWNIVGLIAAKAAGKPLPLLYRERIFQPLGLRHTAYDPQGPIAGAHANGYALAANGNLTDKTAEHPGKGADGAIVTDAKDEARFLTAYSNGTLFDRQFLDELWAGHPSGCGAPLVYLGSGAGDGFKSDVVYAIDGSRVTVLLLNGVTPGGSGFARSAAAAQQPLLRRMMPTA